MELKRQNGGRGLGGGTGACSGLAQLAGAPWPVRPHSSLPPPPPPGREPGWGRGGVSMGSVGGGPKPGCPAPFSAGSAVFFSLSLSLARADPFSASSVISNNVTASLQSIHQSRKKPILTMIKKKKKKNLCLPGTEQARFQPLAPCWPAISPRLGNQIPQGSPPTPGPQSPP